MSIKVPIGMRVVFGLIIIVTLIFILNPSQIFTILLSVNPLYLIPAFLVYALTLLILSFRWQKILDDMGIHIRLPEVYTAFVGGVLISDVTPGRIGDLSRPLLLKKCSDNSTCFLSVVLDRSMDLATIIILGVLGIIFLSPVKWGKFLWVVMIPLAALAIVILFWHKREFLGKIIRTVGIPRLCDLVQNFNDALTSVTFPKKVVLRSLMLTMIAWCGHALRVVIIAASLGYSLQALPLFFILPLISVLSLVPFTLSGLGLVEGTLAFFLSDMGIPLSASLAIALIDRGITVAFHLLIGLPAIKKYITSGYRCDGSVTTIQK